MRHCGRLRIGAAPGTCDAMIVYDSVHQISKENGPPVAQKIQTLLIDDLDGGEAEDNRALRAGRHGV